MTAAACAQAVRDLVAARLDKAMSDEQQAAFRLAEQKARYDVAIAYGKLGSLEDTLPGGTSPLQEIAYRREDLDREKRLTAKWAAALAWLDNVVKEAGLG